MRTLHVGRFPLSGASLLPTIGFGATAYLLPPGIVQGGKHALGDSFGADGTRGKDLHIGEGMVEHRSVPNTKIVKKAGICK